MNNAAYEHLGVSYCVSVLGVWERQVGAPYAASQVPASLLSIVAAALALRTGISQVVNRLVLLCEPVLDAAS